MGKIAWHAITIYAGLLADRRAALPGVQWNARCGNHVPDPSTGSASGAGAFEHDFDVAVLSPAVCPVEATGWVSPNPLSDRLQDLSSWLPLRTGPIERAELARASTLGLSLSSGYSLSAEIQIGDRKAVTAGADGEGWRTALRRRAICTRRQSVRTARSHIVWRSPSPS